MNRIRVVIVDDSPLARALLRSFLEEEGDIEVVGEAGNGRQAVGMVCELKPDLVTMDIEMPVMGGLEAIEEIMHTRAVPILVVSSVADARNALQAVNLGALEVIGKPRCTPEAAAEFTSRIRMLARVPVITHLRIRPSSSLPPPAASLPATGREAPLAGSAYRHVVAIASSTGGPQALARILPALPADFPCPILVAQHISDGFAQGMADWLGSLCALPVRLAREGEIILPGHLYLSPSEQHLAVTPTRRLTLRERAGNDLYHPSCDVLLHSVADVFGTAAVGIILTGMGHDGADGLSAIRKAGGATLAQDEATSVIFGMNQVAIERGAAQQVLPLEEIAGYLRRIAQAGSSGSRREWS